MKISASNVCKATIVSGQRGAGAAPVRLGSSGVMIALD